MVLAAGSSCRQFPETKPWLGCLHGSPMKESVDPAVRELISKHLSSMDHVELLVLLSADESRRWTAERAAEAVHAAVRNIARVLEQLEVAGLLGREGSGDGATFRYAPSQPGMRDAVAALVVMYHQRPVTLVRAIYERPANPLISFAEAFRLKPPGE
jgi:hypothetical protein